MSVDTSTEYGTMSDAAVEKLQSRMGRVYPINRPYVRHVNQDSIGHVARALGDNNPLYTDPDYARGTELGKMVAQPGFFYAVAWGSWDLRRGQGLPGVHGLHSGDGWKYYRPVVEGDVIRAEKELVTAEFKEGRQARRMFYQADEIRFYNQHEELVATQIMPMFRFERGDAKDTGKNAAVAPANYTAEEIAQIDKELAAETPRGNVTRHWEDVKVGDPLDPVIKGPLTVPDMIAWLQGIGSPHVRAGKHWLEYRQQSPKVAVTDPKTGIPQAVERVHWDEYLAQEVGMPSAYDYGSQRGGYASYFASLYPGDSGWVAELDVQYRGMVFLGDVYRISGEIVDTWRGAKTGNGYVKAKLSSINNRDENVMPGTVIFALPTKADGAVKFPVNVEEDGRA